MTPEDALKLLTQIARQTPVNGDVGDKRDEAVQVLQQTINKTKDVTTEEG